MSKTKYTFIGTKAQAHTYQNYFHLSIKHPVLYIKQLAQRERERGGVRSRVKREKMGKGYTEKFENCK